ncbi:polysaccharide export protein [Thioclava atlantica]|uniref:Polysaccharide export protein Wza n=1 Tax=Thioclava atlantica TaxID=1317124 RepID=A0A085TRR9_9RHOB|nr:polysaccharide export protein [Thioclava atlantica]KFE33416.1 polysaccharide export protein Wza [Thioclava atlantica]
MRAMTKLLVAMASLLLLASCDVSATNFPVSNRSVTTTSDPVAGNIAIVRLSAANVATFGAAQDNSGGRTTLPASGYWNYRVGTGDLLDIVVWDHPELTMPAGANRTPAESGLRVQSDGTFFYPYVGQVRARGRTPEEIRSDLAARLKEFIPSPQVSVRVVGYNSQTVSVTGEVNKPSRIPLTSSALTLLDAINEAGGLAEKADARRVNVRRGGRSYSVDLQAFLDQGITSNNPYLHNGDVVAVPRAKTMEAYLLGQLVKPGPIDLTKDDVTLTEAVTAVGGLRQDQADARGVFVFRDTPAGVTVYQLDTSSAAAFVVGTRFYLHPQDVVYVTTAPVAKWNRVISNLLPTLNTARAANSLAN